jgi:hypothetical protein
MLVKINKRYIDKKIYFYKKTNSKWMYFGFNDNTKDFYDT